MMSDPLTMICPVCRARQEAQPACRRCGADLQLYVHAILSRQQAIERYRAAREAGEETIAERELQYLKWLDPGFSGSR
jgi:hypothetical protein